MNNGLENIIDVKCGHSRWMLREWMIEPKEEEVEARNMERIVSRNIDALGKKMDLKLDTISDSVGEVRHLKELMLKSVA
jgi:hypothetical protein